MCGCAWVDDGWLTPDLGGPELCVAVAMRGRAFDLAGVGGSVGAVHCGGVCGR